MLARLQVRVFCWFVLWCCLSVSVPAVSQAQSAGAHRHVIPAVSRTAASGRSATGVRPSLHTVRSGVSVQQESVSAQSATAASGALSELSGAAAATDQRAIESGRVLFQKRCVQCHDAEKSLQKSRTAAEWRSTVARMASQDGMRYRVPSGSRLRFIWHRSMVTRPHARERAGLTRARVRRSRFFERFRRRCGRIRRHYRMGAFFRTCGLFWHGNRVRVR